MQLRLLPWLARELEPNRKLFLDNFPSIPHGALLSAHSLNSQSKYWKVRTCLVIDGLSPVT
jgi:hypothetical protein